MKIRCVAHHLFVAFSCIALAIPGLSGCQGGSSAPPAGSWSSSDSSSVNQTYTDSAQMPADHTVDWMRRHGGIALGQGNDCAVCHSEDDCVECHVESLEQPYTVHPPNYELVHATDASQGMMDCASCHRLDTFCEACHIEAGFAPGLEHSPPSGLDFHPPDWLDATAPQNHGVMARRNINDCASCHIEQDCIACHRGINPHPPEFHLDCDSYLRTDPTPCVQCHIESPDELQQLCF